MDALNDIVERQEKENLEIEKEKEELKKEINEFQKNKERLERQLAELNNGQKEKKIEDINIKEEIKQHADLQNDEKDNNLIPADNTKLKDIINSQADEINNLNFANELNRKIKGSSKEYEVLKKDFSEFQKYMQLINGRVELTQEEMKEYDRLAIKVCKSSEKYLKKKEMEKEKRKEENKDEKKSDYEEKRVNYATAVRDAVERMRQEMFAQRMNEMFDDMEKKCQDKVKEYNEKLGNIAYDDAHPEQTKALIEDCVANTLYYSNRMKQLEKDDFLVLKSSETMSDAISRFDRNINPKKEEIDNILENALTKSIVANGMEKIKEGQKFTSEDIRKEQKTASMKEGREIKNRREQEAVRQKNIQKNQERQRAKDNVLEKKMEQPNNLMNM